MNANRLINRRLCLRWIFVGFLMTAGLPSPSLALPNIAARTRQPLRSQPSRILVKFRDGLGSGPKALAAAGLSPKSEIAGIGVQVIDIPAGQSADEVIRGLKARHGADLQYAEPDHLRYAVSVPNDPGFSSEYHLTKISCPAAWDTTTGSGVTIAIADTGVLTTHPDLAPHLLPGYNAITGTADVTDTEGHGTAVAGSAAAVGNNAIGVVGVAYNASILPIKISNDGTSSDSLIASAIVYAANHGAKVVNVSFNDDIPAPAGCWTQTVIDAAAYMQSKGGLVVVAAGNGGIDKGCPNIPEIIDVASTDENDNLAAFSNFGSEIDVSAPGTNIVTTNCASCSSLPGADTATASGTSFAAPITAGVIALIFSINPSFTQDQAQQILFHSTKDLGASGYDTQFGWGRVNAQDAVSAAVQSAANFQLNSLSNVYAYPNPWDARRYARRQVTVTNLPDAATVKIFTISGFWVKSLEPASNGRAVWDLSNDSGKLVASGLYFYLASNGTTHTVKGTIAIIK